MSKKPSEGRLFTLIWTARIGVFLLMTMVALALDATSSSQHGADVRRQKQIELDELSFKLQSTIYQNIQTVWGLAANVAIQPDIDDQQFQQLAAAIIRRAPELRNIGLAPDYVIRHIYPLAGNEAALGLDLTKRGLPPDQIAKLLKSRKALFYGPFDLVQGGQGLAGRIPVFEQDTGEFWGLISVILDLDRLYQAIGLAAPNSERRLALSTSNSPGDTDSIFFGNPPDRWQAPVSSSLKMPGATWTLFAEPSNGWPNHPKNPWLFRSSMLLIVLAVTGGAFWLTNLLLRDQKMQRRFSGLFELAPIGIGLYDARTKTLMRANATFELSFGHAAQSFDYFENALDFRGEPTSNPLGLGTRLTSQLRFSGLEAYYQLPDEGLTPFLLQGLLLRDSDSESVIWIITENIGEQKQVDRMKSEFISTVSHELRTPLTSVSGALGLLANNAVGVLPEPAARLAEIAHRNSRQLTFLINDLLDIEKLMAGKMFFRRESLTLSDIATKSVEDIETYARQHGVFLRVEDAEAVQVYVDRQRLQQAISNLLSNAIKFSPKGGTVDVFTRCIGNSVRLCIRDHGEGIAPEFHNRIFEKFSQADGSDDRAKGGTGLGLAITRELMLHMDGSVDFESKFGQGATFWLELPIVTSTSARSA